jgi:hypothetical protein
MGFFTGLLLGFFNISQTLVAIPFRVGWGFSPRELRAGYIGRFESQSLSGWDGVFHLPRHKGGQVWRLRRSQSLSGWDGVFHLLEHGVHVVRGKPKVAIPFRVGWGFSLLDEVKGKEGLSAKSQSLSGWDGVFH